MVNRGSKSLWYWPVPLLLGCKIFNDSAELRNIDQLLCTTNRNIVSTVNLDCKLDLKAIALQARNAEYNPKRFAAVIMRIRDPKTTALIFASGKMVTAQILTLKNVTGYITDIICKHALLWTADVQLARSYTGAIKNQYLV